MSVLQKVKEARISAMKARDSVSKSVLTTLVGELEGKAKREGTEINDAMVIHACKKFISTNKETIALLNGRGVAVPDNLLRENVILDKFLPKQLTESQLTTIINNVAVKNVGNIMRHLKDNYAGRYDGKLASKLAKEVS